MGKYTKKGFFEWTSAVNFLMGIYVIGLTSFAFALSKPIILLGHLVTLLWVLAFNDWRKQYSADEEMTYP